ncbi:hypothetical protein SAMN02745221_00243 [Thermosyntropha lipolytica DSM 11003]|uniref:Uncharacterized protein n=1 Tax=Thermosyntropha lipolytica DSM 11003 TaxID=1123382 RepID=A0A1M5JX98_9FIRM|nr:hypothetical protein [Thermosyntropha lipolytica]SHG44653.1 hypothetical protein SAMN02745221_00243 [Thermosyntropha lipolytica DSM 11003]
MLKLDFAFFSLGDKERKGLAGNRLVLERLTPLFFSPRIEKLLYLPYVDKKGCSLKLHLGRQNFKILSPLKKQETMTKAQDLIRSYGLNILAADRRFKDDLLALSKHFMLTFGDNFIKALALAMTERYLSTKAVNRLVIVGRTDDFADLVEEFLKYNLPLSLQSLCPQEDEVMVYKFFYEKGYTLSASYINPEGWQAGDLLLFFDCDPCSFKPALPGVYKLVYHNYSLNLQPEWKEFMHKEGWDAQMHNMAPVLEACLLKEAGIREGESENYNAGKLFTLLKALGDETDLWDMFLDR